jgi:C4-dicarboxylate-specific signal transduction histidine kinase
MLPSDAHEKSGRDSTAVWLDAVHPDDRPATMAAWATCDTMGEFAVKHRIRRAADHIYRWFQSRATPVRVEGRIVGWRGTSTDVEDQARVRAALERSSEELEARVPERTAELQALSVRLAILIKTPEKLRICVAIG